MPPETIEELKPDLFAGGERDPELDEEITGDRGDSLEPVVEQDTPADEPQPEKSVADEPQPEAESAQEPPAGEEKPAEEPEHGEPRIPKSRFDQVNERRKLAEQRLRELEQQLEAQKRAASPTADFDFDAAEQKYMEAMVDGDFEKGKAIRQEIRAAERAAWQAEQAVVREQASAQTLQQLKFEETVAALQADYPVYDPDAQGYDEVLVAEALEVHQGLMSTGKYTAADAIRKAAEMVAKANGVFPASQQKAPEPKAPARDTAPKFAEKAKAANAQPPKQVVGSKGDVTPSVLEMHEDEFNQLPESTLRRLRGDVF